MAIVVLEGVCTRQDGTQGVTMCRRSADAVWAASTAATAAVQCLQRCCTSARLSARICAACRPSQGHSLRPSPQLCPR